MERNADTMQQLKVQGYLGDEIITGEAVALEIPPVTVFTRIVTGIIDTTLYFFLLMGFLQIINLLPKPNRAIATATTTATTALCLWLIPALITGFTHGSSLGKRLLRVRVVRSDGGTLTMRQSFVRSTVGLIEIWTSSGVLAMATAFFNKRSQRLGDILAGTYAVHWPKNKLRDFQLGIAPPLQNWATTAQTRAIPGGLTLNIVNFFQSANKLMPEVRLKQAQVLAATVERYVSPPPPWNTPAEEFLAAFLTIRHNVETQQGKQTTQRQANISQAVQKIPYSL